MFNPIKRYLPTEDYIKKHPRLKFLEKYLHHKDFWHLNEKSVAHALLVGLFVTVIPIPGQMILAVLLGIPLRANLLLAVALVWLSNPLTMGPIAFVAYCLGRVVLQLPMIPVTSLDAFLKNIHLIWEPFLVGSLLLGLILGAVGYLLSRLIAKVLWRRF
jgi:uncharacterized protein